MLILALPQASAALLRSLPPYTDLTAEVAPGSGPTWLTDHVQASRVQFLMAMLTPCMVHLQVCHMLCDLKAMSHCQPDRGVLLCCWRSVLLAAAMHWTGYAGAWVLTLLCGAVLSQAWLPQDAHGLCFCLHLFLCKTASCVVQGEPAERAVSVPLLYLQHPTAAVSSAAHRLVSATLQQTPQVKQLPPLSSQHLKHWWAWALLRPPVMLCLSVCEHGL